MKKPSGYAAYGATFAAVALLAACGGGSDNGIKTDNSGDRGSLMTNPPLRVTTLSAADFLASLNGSATGKGLLQVAGAPKCGVDFNYLEYGTVGAVNEKTNASGALMVPVGTDAACTGPRPIVLYAHGTTTGKNYNIANVLDSVNNPAYSEALLVAAMYAAQGFIVVAPNYAGYDTSKLGYHPYLVADQQSKDMIDALTAARKALGNVNTADSGKLFITGYSQGGHVAMATHKAMQEAKMTVTASAPMSGPYALAAFGDAVYFGNVNLGSTIFTPLLVNAYQKAYGNLYTNLTDIYSANYATGIDTLLPSLTPIGTLIAQGKLPQTAMFSSTPPTAPPGSPPSLQPTLNAITPPTTPAALAPLFALGFGTSPLVTNASRLSYLLDALANPDGAVPALTTGAQATAPKDPMRIAAKINDLRNWTPTRPVLLCAGNSDPTVFYSVNTQLMQGFWSAPSPAKMAPGLLTVVDVDSAPTGAADAFAAAKLGFAQAKAGTAQSAVAAGATDGGASAVTQAYHGSLVPPFCNATARGFFQQVLAAGL